MIHKNPLLSAVVCLLCGLAITACSSDDDNKDNDSDEHGLLLNEIKANIPEDEHAYQYIELKGKADSELSNTYLLVLDGDDDEEVAGESPGYVDFAVDLSGVTVGSNGLVLVKGTGQYEDISDTTLVDSASIRTYDEDTDGEQFADGIIEHDAITFMLVSSPSTALNSGADLDADNDGVLELPDDAEILDAVSWQDGGEGIVYSDVILTQSASDPDAATRFSDNTTALSASAWANGDIFEDPSKEDEDLPAEILYDPSQASTSLPPNARLTPGKPNFKAAPFVLLNEVVTEADSGESLELIANPGQALDDVYAFALDNTGMVTYSSGSLSGHAVGTSGLLLMQGADVTAAVVTSTNLFQESQFAAAGVFDSAGMSLVLAYSPGLAINVGDDLDADDDGSLDAQGDTLQVLDAIAWGSGTLYADSVLDTSLTGNALIAASRYRENRAVAASSWAYGQLLNDGVSYDESLSRNEPEGGFVTLGGENIAQLAAAQVTPTLETARSSQSGSDADDLAFWINPSDASASLVIASQKTGGYSVYDVDGNTLLDAKPDNVRHNNVDVIYGFDLNGTSVDLAIFTDRQSDKFAIYSISATAPYLTNITDPDGPVVFGGEAGEDTSYGQAVYKSVLNDSVYAFATRNGSWEVAQVELQANADGSIGWQAIRLITLEADDDDKHGEGMVVDQEYGTLFIAQEEVGIYTVDAEPGASPVDVALTEADLFVEEGDDNLVEDIEGIALYYKNDGSGYLLVSSQGSSTFGVYDRQTQAFIQAFSIVENVYSGVDGSEHCDGLDITNVPFGDQFTHGALIVQDGTDYNAVSDDKATNFKWIAWDSLAAELELDSDTAYNPRAAQNRR